MESRMQMNIETTWGNQVTLVVKCELDNAHDLTTTELSRLMVYTLVLMVAEVRRENERVSLEKIDERERVVGGEDGPARERERYTEMERARGEVVS